MPSSQIDTQSHSPASFSVTSSFTTRVLPNKSPSVHQFSTPSTVPESIFGWQALLVALQVRILFCFCSTVISRIFYLLTLVIAALSSFFCFLRFCLLQSAVGSLKIFRRLPAFGTSSSAKGTSSSSVPHSPAHMSVPLQTIGHSDSSSSPSAPMGSQASTDVIMMPVSQSSEEEACADVQTVSPAPNPTSGTKLDFTSLPDELIAMCYADLSAADLVALELVSKRLRHLIAYDAVCWRRCVENRWGYLTCNYSILAAAARHAGTWKQLYSEKARIDKEKTPWLTLCKSETLAVLDIIKGENPVQKTPTYWPMNTDTPDATPSSPPEDSVLRVSSSPVSVISGSYPTSCLSVVLLIDASSSVTDDDFDTMKDFSKSLVENLRTSHPDACVALVQFNQHPKVEVRLTNVCKTKLTNSIENMEQLMGSTDIAAPIRRARQILAEEASPGDRAIVLLTDGQTHADELQESEREARKATEEVGARLYTLGVGRDIDEIGLGRVADGSEGGMHFTLRRLVPAK